MNVAVSWQSSFKDTFDQVVTGNVQTLMREGEQRSISGRCCNAQRGLLDEKRSFGYGGCLLGRY